MPLSLTRVLGNHLLPDSCYDVHTHFKRNCYELAGQLASQYRQPVEMVTQAFVANGARTAVSSANWNLRCKYARTRLSALRFLRSTPVRRELEGLEGFHENELG